MPFPANESGSITTLPLLRVDGLVYAFNGSELPKVLEGPRACGLSGKSDGVYGITSGGRLVIVKSGGKWYKLKGCRPVLDGDGRCARYTEEHDEPHGAMAREVALNELKAAERIAKRLRSHDVVPPLEPIGRMEYEVRYKESPANCAVMLTRGDARLAYASVHNFLWADLQRRKLAAEWLGFLDKILQEARVSYAVSSMVADNVLIYKAGDGLGIGLVDFERAILDGADHPKLIGFHLASLFPDALEIPDSLKSKWKKVYFKGLERDSHPEFLA